MRHVSSQLFFSVTLVVLPGLLSCACSRRGVRNPASDLLLVGGNVYTLAWPEPGLDGSPDRDAPHGSSWKGDAQALAIRGNRIVFVGSDERAERWRAGAARVVDLHGATVVPGLVDAHVHIVELGRMLERVNLVGVATEEQAVEKVAARAAGVPKGQWVLGYGWDDGAWANHYPTMALLSSRVPDHPVYLRGLHGYAVWGNRLAFERAKITAGTQSPAGGEIRKGPDGQPTGILLNQAVGLLESAIPAPTVDQIETLILKGLEAMAAGGYVAVHEAGADWLTMAALEKLDAEGRLPLRVFAMLSGSDHALLRKWLAKGPDTPTERHLTTMTVKVFFDGALGSRGARLLDDYSDRPGERGVGGPEPGFDPGLTASMMKAGFQVAIHAIGDGANREALDFIESAVVNAPSARQGRHRIEHAQVLDAADVPRFARLGVIASMNPPHAVEDMGWVEDRIGVRRAGLAYAWRTIRQTGARMVFSSDLPGTDYDIFYGLHSAVTRQDRQGRPAGGWHAAQRMTPEEALRGYTTWAAYSAFLEDRTGLLAPGRWADVTVMDIDPLAVGEGAPSRLLAGKIRMTIVGGKVIYQAATSR
jgi:predicted amidohydrolase YtcJ